MRLACLLLPLAFLGCSCVSIQRQDAEFDTRTMMASAVYVEVDIRLTLIPYLPESDIGKQILAHPDQEPMGYSGSGVVYGHVGGVTSPRHSLILTANHVADYNEVIGELQAQLATIAEVRIKSVTMTVRNEGKVCEAHKIVGGANDFRDVAVLEAECEFLDEAPIASHYPPIGAKVYAVGYPLGVQATLVTEGYYSGIDHGYMISSVPVAHGNSGGPVYYNGEIVGLVVRVASEYEHISLLSSLDEIKDRVNSASNLK